MTTVMSFNRDYLSIFHLIILTLKLRWMKLTKLFLQLLCFLWTTQSFLAICTLANKFDHLWTKQEWLSMEIRHKLQSGLKTQNTLFSRLMTGQFHFIGFSWTLKMVTSQTHHSPQQLSMNYIALTIVKIDHLDLMLKILLLAFGLKCGQTISLFLSQVTVQFQQNALISSSWTCLIEKVLFTQLVIMSKNVLPHGLLQITWKCHILNADQ